MRRQHLTICSVIGALLFVGSGCETSDTQTVMEILGGSQGVTAGEFIGHGFGVSTGDEGKDDLLETADTIDKIKKAANLEESARAALQQKPPDYAAATKDLEDAAVLRPKDWSLQNQLNTLRAEQGASGKNKPHFDTPGSICLNPKTDSTNHRCWRNVMRERGDQLEASVERQKRSGALVSCSTYEVLETHYNDIWRLNEETFVKLGMTAADRIRAGERSEFVGAMTREPGKSCRL